MQLVDHFLQSLDATTMQNNSNMQTDITNQLVQQDIPTALHEKKQSLDDDDSSCFDVSTKSIRPLDQLENRPSTSRPQFKAKSTIYTDSPVRNLLLLQKK